MILAELNEKNIVTNVTELDTNECSLESINPHVFIDNYDTSLLGKKYENGKFIDVITDNISA